MLGTLLCPILYVENLQMSDSPFSLIENLQHIRFGRMEKRFEEKAARSILNAIEHATGSSFSESEINDFARGADEIDLVNSGLEETMIESYHGIRNIAKRLDGAIDLRTASMIDAIDKIGLAYSDRGIFP